MKLRWQIEDDDVSQVRRFLERNYDDTVVVQRWKINVEKEPFPFSHRVF